jgi:hypothetical protein
MMNITIIQNKQKFRIIMIMKKFLQLCNLILLVCNRLSVMINIKRYYKMIDLIIIKFNEDKISKNLYKKKDFMLLI